MIETCDWSTDSDSFWQSIRLAPTNMKFRLKCSQCVAMLISTQTH